MKNFPSSHSRTSEKRKKKKEEFHITSSNSLYPQKSMKTNKPEWSYQWAPSSVEDWKHGKQFPWPQSLSSWASQQPHPRFSTTQNRSNNSASKLTNNFHTKITANLLPRRDDNSGSFKAEALGDGEADALSGGRDDRHLPLKSPRHESFLISSSSLGASLEKRWY